MRFFDSVLSKLVQVKSGMVTATGNFTTTNSHVQVPGTPTTVNVPAGMVLCVDIGSILQPGSNTVGMALRLDGTEQTGALVANTTTTAGRSYRFAGLSAGNHTLDLVAYATTSAGAFDTASTYIRWLLLPA
jgi:hypothetical protein